jgi:hypothetical protein
MITSDHFIFAYTNGLKLRMPLGTFARFELSTATPAKFVFNELSHGFQS